MIECIMQLNISHHLPFRAGGASGLAGRQGWRGVRAGGASGLVGRQDWWDVLAFIRTTVPGIFQKMKCHTELGFQNGFEIRKLEPLIREGTYCLDDGSIEYCTSLIQYVPKCLNVSQEDFQSLWDFGMSDDTVKPTIFMGSRVHRKQATFGGAYNFSKQKSTVIYGPEESWPNAVQIALDDARLRSSIMDTLKMVHVNWYPDGKANLMPHADDEKGEFMTQKPIYSYTLLKDPEKPRGFQIYRKCAPKHAICDVKLGNGDLLVMAGEMQNHYLHGVKRTQAATSPRINITVRSVDNTKKMKV